MGGIGGAVPVDFCGVGTERHCVFGSALVLCCAQEAEKYNEKKLLCMLLSWGLQGQKLSCGDVSR